MDNHVVIERIKKHYQQDLASNAKAQSLSDIPIAYENVTNSWLSAVLGKGRKGLSVIAHQWGAVDNGSSNRRKLQVTYNDTQAAQGLPTQFFCKATHDLENRVVLGVSGAAHSEVLFYNQLNPLLNIEVPNSYHADLNQASCNYIVILSDLACEGVRFCDHQTPMTFELAQSQMNLLAAMHGAGYQNPVLKEHLKQLPTWPEFFNNTLAFGMEQGCAAGFLAAEEVIPQRLFKQHQAIWPATLESVNKHLSAELTLTHGDVHLKNWYITSKQTMGLGDWQCANRGHWSRDFAYALSTALTPEQRRAWEQELLKEYLDKLHQAGGPKISFAQGFDEYRGQLVGALAWWTLTLCPPQGVADLQPPETSLEFIKRISTAMDDLDILA